jgi:hypothetical protein
VHPQLEAVLRELDEAEARLDRLAAQVPPDWWQRRPDPARWSIAECVAHLNLTADAYLPLLRDALERARTLGRPAPRRHRRDPTGWLLWRLAGPPVRVRVRTTAPFVPTSLRPPAEILAAFERAQEQQRSAVRQADGLPLGAVRITSPFDPRLRYNLYACLTILPRHQHRHLWQAERVLVALRGEK